MEVCIIYLRDYLRASIEETQEEMEKVIMSVSPTRAVCIILEGIIPLAIMQERYSNISPPAQPGSTRAQELDTYFASYTYAPLQTSYLASDEKGEGGEKGSNWLLTRAYRHIYVAGKGEKAFYYRCLPHVDEIRFSDGEVFRRQGKIFLIEKRGKIFARIHRIEDALFEQLVQAKGRVVDGKIDWKSFQASLPQEGREYRCEGAAMAIAWMERIAWKWHYYSHGKVDWTWMYAYREDPPPHYIAHAPILPPNIFEENYPTTHEELALWGEEPLPLPAFRLRRRFPDLFPLRFPFDFMRLRQPPRNPITSKPVRCDGPENVLEPLFARFGVRKKTYLEDKGEEVTFPYREIKEWRKFTSAHTYLDLLVLHAYTQEDWKRLTPRFVMVEYTRKADVRKYAQGGKALKYRLVHIDEKYAYFVRGDLFEGLEELFPHVDDVAHMLP